MAIVTGDRYLDLLARFVEENIGLLLDGGRVLKLNPVGLHYVQSRLEALQELEQLRSSAPVDYLRAYVADLGDHRALELLRRVLRLLGAVKVVSVLQAPARDPTPINLLPCGRLRSLELRGCDLSTTAARGLLELRPVLEKLLCYNSADALRHIFAERIVDIGDAPTWTRLTSVSCACNEMLLMDESLQLLPVVEVLDLSRNRLSHVANLQKCLRLKFLDLSFNRLQNLSALHQASITITTLLLRNNALSSTNGIERLRLLETLDLSRNIISSFSELEKLATLPFLHLLLLNSNPISFSSKYRVQVLSFFPDPNKLFLDGKHMTQRESWEVRRIAASNHEKVSAYGLYVPAKRNLMDDSSQEPLMMSSDASEVAAEKAKRKNYRLAAIHEEGEIKLLGVTEQVNEPSISHHASSLPNYNFEQAMPISRDSNLQSEMSVEKLMNQVEILKREGSNSWLRDFNKFLEVYSDDSNFSRYFDSNLTGRREQRSRLVRRRKKKVVRDKMLSDIDGPKFGHNGDHKEINGKESLDALNVFEELVDAKLSSSSVASPPHYNDNLLQRRQDLEEELLQLRVDSRVSSSSSDSETSSETSAVPIYDSSTSATEYGQKYDCTIAGLNKWEQRFVVNDSKTVPEEVTGKVNALLNGDEGYFLTPGWIGSKGSNQKVESQNSNGGEPLGVIVEVSKPGYEATASESDLPEPMEVCEKHSSANLILPKPKSSKRIRRVVLLEEEEERNKFDLEVDVCAGSLSEGDLSKQNGKASCSDMHM
ncbi:hypothetical protein O6H91_11G060300 [Diphasiastrum complanatum]|uniref:Uncharacterized protein n=1 Tax=Diphasiastrum complanatum TaxID=34168 RepID=A0ACC2C9T9_DIPCM|nr:hypothetical protein O6H91_11G060300 [Diphasiastrum complanatum]